MNRKENLEDSEKGWPDNQDFKTVFVSANQLFSFFLGSDLHFHPLFWSVITVLSLISMKNMEEIEHFIC